jgi:hypothetical protein
MRPMSPPLASWTVVAVAFVAVASVEALLRVAGDREGMASAVER